MPYSDESLAGRLLNDDPEALEQVLRWISGAVTSPRFWLLRGEWPDLMQDVLARVVESLRQERFAVSRDLRVYVQGIARFASLQALDRRARQASLDPVPPEDGGDGSPEARAIERLLARSVLDAASEDCRELFRMYFFEARGHQEIADRLGIPIGTVKSRLFRCLECAHEMIVPRAPRVRHRVGQ